MRGYEAIRILLREGPTRDIKVIPFGSWHEWRPKHRPIVQLPNEALRAIDRFRSRHGSARHQVQYYEHQLDKWGSPIPPSLVSDLDTARDVAKIRDRRSRMAETIAKLFLLSYILKRHPSPILAGYSRAISYDAGELRSADDMITEERVLAAKFRSTTLGRRSIQDWEEAKGRFRTSKRLISQAKRDIDEAIEFLDQRICPCLHT